MYNNENESSLEYKKRVLDSIGPTYCAGKALGGTVWLGAGMSAQCHHPPASKIPLEEIVSNYKSLLNTDYRKRVRKEMIDGKQVQECSYCWKVENLDNNLVSDRVYKTMVHPDNMVFDTVNAYKTMSDITPNTLEISFDNLCNFACSYCNASFSSTWAHDIKKNGAYQDLISDGGGAYMQNGDWAAPYGIKNVSNPYTAAFWQWWENELQYSLTELRITGGEGTMSPDFWKLLEWWKAHPECKTRLAINSNLGAKKELIEKLCDATHSFKDFDLYTSNESFGIHAEYIRDGLVWDDWIENLGYLIRNGNIKNTHVMMTINALCLFSMTKFMDMMLDMKRVYGRNHCTMSFNILRFPSFMSVVTLPKEIRLEQANRLKEWLQMRWFQQPIHQDGRGYLHNMEFEGINRLISYLEEIEEGHNHTSSLESRQRDFKTFFVQYDDRRHKNFRETFSELVEWYDSIPITSTGVLRDLIDGDSSKGLEHVQKELLEKAKEEGWILEPSDANPGSQDYVEVKSIDDIIDGLNTSNE